MIQDLASKEVAYTIGPVIVGVISNAILYGICVLQFHEYYASCIKDRWWIRGLVHWTLILDTCTSVYLLWLYAVTNFGSDALLQRAPWPFAQTPVVTVPASLPIQIFLSWRIKLFPKSWLIFSVLVFFAATQWTAGIVSSIFSFLIPDTAGWQELVPVVDLWMGSALVCDLNITILLLRYLRIRQTGIAKGWQPDVHYTIRRSSEVNLQNTLLTNSQTLNNRAWIRQELALHVYGDSETTSRTSRYPGRFFERKREVDSDLGSLEFANGQDVQDANSVEYRMGLIDLGANTSHVPTFGV
ncbi:hypothetical protein PUNSTDRAFT_124062 [Punctularia strigosozonata HHB-11173 SS5]|uniref:uncharacterized protein n=1 Tax=Punctularia strigosozonata (strain HHB-11173) TaxID=741275 RepID=UPI00044176C9|nr:uncharacterized protein PUNSTDRAFT_124062 [Punctularia strigosozonata HHB-11173 SS5]EIN14578.1 hypothetical protein PUNSTDRAFT_124062 [Punctularia strigosozonata HHB-11173 SS5]